MTSGERTMRVQSEGRKMCQLTALTKQIKSDKSKPFPETMHRLIPLIGALLLSASPVQASQTFKEITRPCKASEKTNNACDAMAIHFSAIATYSFLCRVEQASKETPEALNQKPKVHGKTERKKEVAKIAFNAAIEKVKRSYPNCSVKPIP